ncbi:MAG: hypothetical protein ACLRM8_03150 [Alistipes sp.]
MNLSRDLRYRVTADCYDPAQIVRMPMFILPPAQVVLQEAASRLPSAAAFASGTFGQRGGRQSDRHRLPQPGRVLVAPKSLEGEAQSLVFTAIHRDRNAVLYWHIDDNYIGATTLEHKISVRPAPGAHRLTVIDEHGARQASPSAAADRRLRFLAVSCGCEGLCAGCRAGLSEGLFRAYGGLPMGSDFGWLPRLSARGILSRRGVAAGRQFAGSIAATGILGREA